MSKYVVRRAIFAAALALPFALLAACGSGPSESSCKAAAERFVVAALPRLANGEDLSDTPELPACKGLSEDVRTKLFGEVMSEHGAELFAAAMAGAFANPS